MAKLPKQRRPNLDENQEYNPAEEEVEMLEKRYVKVRDRVSLMSLCGILQKVGEDYGVCEETIRGYWVPCWFFMAVWPAAKAGDLDKAYENAHRVVFSESHRKAMETKYGMTRSLQVDCANVGVWE